MQCDDCMYVNINRGRLVPELRGQRSCMAVEKVGDPVVRGMLERLLLGAAADGRCTEFETHAAFPDSYRSEDLPIE